ncbi:MAG: hypothetical protein Q2306_02065 [Phytoplasma sp.]|uniref:hypothetical protein n=1 Tax=Phytoplasma sp. TaxID=2155 RepID=UPI002B416C86|nr:hypothetical protein [Phytoplasma sp.]WRH06661.1 MAG: hypothetical protein Q2306_02065 [Phytoplasma sp.]
MENLKNEEIKIINNNTNEENNNDEMPMNKDFKQQNLFKLFIDKIIIKIIFIKIKINF